MITLLSAHKKTSSHQGFLPAIESARGIAAVAVVLFHFLAYPEYISRRPGFLANAYLCVDFFFVLSGFILARGYVDRIASPADLWRFCILRIGRIWPLHVLYVAAFLAFAAHESIQWSHKDIFLQLGMLHALPIAEGGFQFNPPSWSISAEWLCYLLFAFFVFTIPSRFRLAACLLLATAGLAGVCMHIKVSMNDLTHAWGASRGVYGFFCGVALCLVTSRWTIAVPGWSASLPLVAFFVLKPADSLLDLAAPLVFAPVVIWLASDLASHTWLGREFFIRIGTYSYSIYLGHMLLYAVAMKALGFFWPSGPPLEIALPAVLALIYLASSITYKLVENPARRAFRVFVPSAKQ